jgi:hypothetical protein
MDSTAAATRAAAIASSSRLEALTRVLVSRAIGQFLGFPDKIALAQVSQGILQTLSAAAPHPIVQRFPT